MKSRIIKEITVYTRWKMLMSNTAVTIKQTIYSEWRCLREPSSFFFPYFFLLFLFSLFFIFPTFTSAHHSYDFSFLLHSYLQMMYVLLKVTTWTCNFQTNSILWGPIITLKRSLGSLLLQIQFTNPYIYKIVYI